MEPREKNVIESKRTLTVHEMEWTVGSHAKKHIGEFAFYLKDDANKSAGHKRVLRELSHFSNGMSSNTQFDELLKVDRAIVNELYYKVLGMVQETVKTDPKAFKTGNAQTDSMVYCWKFRDGKKYLVMVVTRNEEKRTFSDVNTFYLNTDTQFRAKFSSLRVMADQNKEKGRMVIMNYNDFDRTINKTKKPTQVLANVDFSNFIAPEKFKNQWNDAPEDQRDNIARLHPNVPITDQHIVSDIIQFHHFRYPEQFQMLLTSNFFGHGVIPSLIRHGLKFKRFGLIQEDIMDVFDLLPEKRLPKEEEEINYKEDMKKVVQAMRDEDKKDWKLPGFKKWLRNMENIHAQYFWKTFFEIEGMEERSFNNITQKLRELQENVINAVMESLHANPYEIKNKDTILVPLKNSPENSLIMHLAERDLKHETYDKPLRIILEVDIENA